MSPIPLTKKAAPTLMEKGAVGAARTVVERAPQAKSRVGMFVGVAAVVILAIGGFAGWRMIARDTGTSKAAVVTPAGTQVAANAADSQAAQPQTKAPEGGAPPNANPPAAVENTAAQANELKVAGVQEKESAALANRGGSHVALSGVPAGATVTLDGRRQVGAQFNVRAGVHDLRIDAAGYAPMSRRITLRPGERLRVAFESVRAPAAVAVAPKQDQGLATLRLILVPPSTISIDGSSKGQQSRLIEEVVPGTHTLRIEHDGFAAKDTVVTVSGGQTATIKIQLTERRP